jgi:hypothetical protein
VHVSAVSLHVFERSKSHARALGTFLQHTQSTHTSLHLNFSFLFQFQQSCRSSYQFTFDPNLLLPPLDLFDLHSMSQTAASVSHSASPLSEMIVTTISHLVHAKRLHSDLVRGHSFYSFRYLRLHLNTVEYRKTIQIISLIVVHLLGIRRRHRHFNLIVSHPATVRP